MESRVSATLRDTRLPRLVTTILIASSYG
jgi:hypothetical protein